MITKILPGLAIVQFLTIAGLVALHVIERPLPEAAEQRSTSLKQNHPYPGAKPISDSLAYQFFHDYHRSANAHNSQGPLRNGGRAIVQFYIGEADLIQPLKQKAAELRKDFIGLSAIPAYDARSRSNTLIWLAVVDADTSSGVSPELMLPRPGEAWENYIYDYTTVCPDYCPTNASQLWNVDWQP